MFNATATEEPPMSEEESHLVLIVTLLGHLPLEFIQSGKWSERFYNLETGKPSQLSTSRNLA